MLGAVATAVAGTGFDVDNKSARCRCKISSCLCVAPRLSRASGCAESFDQLKPASSARRGRSNAPAASDDKGGSGGMMEGSPKKSPNRGSILSY